MRYFRLEPLAITMLPLGIGVTASAGRGVSTGGAATGFHTRFLGTAIEAIAVAAITSAADHHLTVTASTVVEAG